MEVTPGASGVAQAPLLKAQVALQAKASDQKEAVVATLLEGTTESAAKAEVTGKNLLAVA